MEIINKPDLKVFASEAKSGEIAKFPDILRGWGITFEQTQGKPPLEWMNDAFNRVDLNNLYLLQQGIPEWQKEIRYPKNAVVKKDGKIYLCLVENEDSEPSKANEKWGDLFSDKRDLDDNIFNGLMTIKSDNDEQGVGILLQESDGTVRGQVVATDQGLQLTQHPKDGELQTFTFPSGSGELALLKNTVNLVKNHESILHSISGKLKTATLDNESLEISSPIKIVASGKTIKGNTIAPPVLSDSQISSEVFPVFDVDATMTTLTGIGIKTSERKFEDSTRIGMRFKKSVNSDDMDGNIISNGFHYVTTGIEYWGRGINAKNNIFAQVYDCIKYEWDDSTVEISNDIQGLENGMRANIVTLNRGHLCKTLFNNTGEHSEHLQGLLFTNNMLDVGGTLFKGSTKYGVFGNNIALLSQLNHFVFNSGFNKSNTITGNSLGGNEYSLDDKTPRYSIDSSVDSLSNSYVGNSFSNIQQSVFNSTGKIKNCAIVGNTAHKVGDNFPNSSSFIKSSDIIDNVSIIGNTVDESTRSLIGSGSISNSSIIGNSGEYRELIHDSVEDAGGNLVVDNVHGLLVGVLRSEAKLHVVSDVNNNTDAVFERVDKNHISLKFKNGSDELKLLISPTTYISPEKDGEINLGGSVNKFKDIYLLNNPTVTSDANAKNDIKDIDERYMKVMSRLKFRQFKLNSGTSGRIHFGIIAQEWIKACEDENVDPYESGVLVGSEESGYAIRYAELMVLHNAYMSWKLDSLI